MKTRTLAQLVERLPYTQNVVSSNLASPTTIITQEKWMSDLESFESNNEEEAEIAQILTLQRNSAAVNAIRAKIGTGPSLSHCEECGEEIPTARQQAIAGCKTCIECQSYAERWKK